MKGLILCLKQFKASFYCKFQFQIAYGASKHSSIFEAPDFWMGNQLIAAEFYLRMKIEAL